MLSPTTSLSVTFRQTTNLDQEKFQNNAISEVTAKAVGLLNLNNFSNAVTIMALPSIAGQVVK